MKKNHKSILGYFLLGFLCIITGFNVVNGLINKEFNDFFMLCLFFFVVALSDLILMYVNIGYNNDERIRLIKLKASSYAGLTNLVILLIFVFLNQFAGVNGHQALQLALICSILPFSVLLLLFSKRI